MTNSAIKATNSLVPLVDDMIESLRIAKRDYSLDGGRCHYDDGLACWFILGQDCVSNIQPLQYNMYKGRKFWHQQKIGASLGKVYFPSHLLDAAQELGCVSWEKKDYDEPHNLSDT